ncbi:MAG: hypothetical protein JWP85_143 [Rhodoglobus sp.]|nr:hypothetical protein [Rhodoglobus sp.]
MNVFVELDELTPEETTTGTYSSIFNSPTPTMDKVDVHLRSLNPGKSWAAPHPGPEHIIIVKSGELEVSINGDVKPATAKAYIFFGANDVNSIKNVGSTPAEIYVTTFYTAATFDPELQTPADEALGSFVSQWDDVPAEAQPLSDKLPVAWYRERRKFVTPQKTATSPRIYTHATTIDPGSGISYHNTHHWVVLFFILEGGFDFDVQGLQHRSGPGSFYYMAEEAPHTQIPWGDGDTCYYVVHVSSEKTPV